MKNTTLLRNQALFKLAETQEGLFTSQQAIRLGFQKDNHPYHVERGNWAREERGIYRLIQYPRTDEQERMIWYLWSRNKSDVPQGVYSHETALDIYHLSDLNPTEYHLTVPKGFRRTKIPRVLVLHEANLKPSDYRTYYGYKVTTPLRTLLDIASEPAVSEEFVVQAIVEAVSRGLVSRNKLNAVGLYSPYRKEIEAGPRRYG